MIASTTINSIPELDYQPPRRNTVEKSKTWKLLTSRDNDSKQIAKQKQKIDDIKEHSEAITQDRRLDEL